MSIEHLHDVIGMRAIRHRAEDPLQIEEDTADIILDYKVSPLRQLDRFSVPLPQARNSSASYRRLCAKRCVVDQGRSRIMRRTTRRFCASGCSFIAAVISRFSQFGVTKGRVSSLVLHTTNFLLVTESVQAMRRFDFCHVPYPMCAGVCDGRRVWCICLPVFPASRHICVDQRRRSHSDWMVKAKTDDCKKVPRALKQLVRKYTVVLELSVIMPDFQGSRGANAISDLMLFSKSVGR